MARGPVGPCPDRGVSSTRRGGGGGISLLVAAALCVLASALPLASAPLRVHAQSPRVQSRSFSVRGPAGGRQRALAVWPTRRKNAERWPVLVAFHGMGESKRGPKQGFRAWVDDYGLMGAYQALFAPPLTAQAFGGLVRDDHLSVMNADLKKRAFRGVFVVGVYTPDLLSTKAQRTGGLERFSRWVAEELLPDVRDTFPVADPSRETTGVDGVSLGGFVALSVGFRQPEAIGVVGAMQPAIRGDEADLAALAAAAASVKPQRIRLLSSDDDPLLGPTRTLSQALRERHIPHALRVVPGPHGYAFNRGPGALDMLWYHDRALRGLSNP